MNRKYFIFSVYVVLQSLFFSLGSVTTKSVSTQERLVHGNVTSIQPMKEYLKKQGKTSDFYNEVYVVTLDDSMKAVFKPDVEENEMYGEIAAYKASEFTALHRVPPTVKRVINGKKGSLQVFVDSSMVNNFDQMYSKVPEYQCADCEAFQFVFGKWDRGPDNYLFVQKQDGTNDLILIDNAGLVQNQQVKITQFPFVRYTYCDNHKDSWNDPFPFNKVQEVQYNDIFNHSDFKSLKLPKTAFKFLKEGNKSLRYVFWRNGLWIQPYSGSPYIPKTLSSRFYEILKKLTYKDVEKIWQMCPKYWTKKRKKEMIEATLDRRDQLLAYLAHHSLM